jgi:hypothetical protein
VPISQDGRIGALAIRGDEGWWTLVTIDHETFAAPLRLVNQPFNIVSRGNTFLRSGFVIELPTSSNNVPTGKARVWNVRRYISRLIENLQTSPTFLIEIVVPSDLDTVIDYADLLELSRATANPEVIEGTLTQRVYIDEPLPSGRMTEQYFPWLGR